MCRRFQIVSLVLPRKKSNLSLSNQVPLFSPTSKPLLPPTSEQELVLFVGYPCLGKTRFFRRRFEPAGYTHVNQDNLKNRNKCIDAVRDALRNKLSCVVGQWAFSFYLHFC